MSDSVVWLDSDKAHIFALKVSGIEKSNVSKNTFDHHTSNKKDRKVDAGSEPFFHDIASKLNSDGDILIMGPGEAKLHFKSHLENHHHGALAKRIVGVETSDHPTDHQIIATAKTFFKKYDMFHSAVINIES